MNIKKIGRNFSGFEQVLFLIAFFLVILIVSGTIIAFSVKKAELAKGMRRIDPSPTQIEKTTNSSVFTGIGQLRAITADKPPVTLVVFPYFSYSEKDTALFEELVQKTKKIRAIILDYVLVHSHSQLIEMGELAVKEELLQLINAEIVLGKIEQIYFDEYIFF